MDWYEMPAPETVPGLMWVIIISLCIVIVALWRRDQRKEKSLVSAKAAETAAYKEVTQLSKEVTEVMTKQSTLLEIIAKRD